jgi:YfiH family protein
MSKWIAPHWPAPTWVRAITTTRDFANLALRENADPQTLLNRLKLKQQFNLKQEPAWLTQTHSPRVIKEEGERIHQEKADGAWTQKRGLPCVVLTGDCLPLLLTDTKGSFVGAVHCGWRGILNNIIENAITQIKPKAEGEILAWMGPAISRSVYEVGSDVRDPFLAQNLAFESAFKSALQPGKWWADLHQLARLKLQQSGIVSIYGSEHCTYTDKEAFYSYRRDKTPNRMATLIWLGL